MGFISGYVSGYFLSALFVLYLGMLKNNHNYNRKKINLTVKHDLHLTNSLGLLYFHFDETDKHGELIQSFNLTESNCYEKYLKIDFFNYIDPHSGEMLKNDQLPNNTAYLPNVAKHTMVLSKIQEYSSNCLRIKRYRINETHHLILIDEQPYVVETNRYYKKDENTRYVKNFEDNIGKVIEMKLLNDFNIITYILFKFKYYNEENDDILLYNIYKDLTSMVIVFESLRFVKDYLIKKFSTFVNVV